MQPSDQPDAQAASTANLSTVSRDDASNGELEKGMTQARVAAERPFAAFAPTVPR
jgi:hypothetical protein